MNINTHLVYNAVKCNYCNEVIVSRFRNNFVVCTCGKTATDGGLEYQRIIGDNLEILSVYNYEPFHKVRNYFSRYNNYAKEYVPLKDMDIEWLWAISDYYLKWKDENRNTERTNGGINDWALILYLQEKLVKNEEEY